MAPKSRFTIRRWDEESVVFDGVSGDTHLLSAIDARILQLFIDAPAVAHSSDSLMAVYGSDEVESVLAEFEKCGFILRA